MKDLDFDEIDRAVNSVISNEPSGNSNAPVELTLPVSTNEAQPTAATGNTPKPLAARRSSGQFMDVVHPSSDMRRSPSAVPERQTPAAPLGQTELSEVPPTTSVVGPKSEEATPTSPTVGQPSTDSYSDADIDKLSDDINKALGQTTDSALESPFISGTKVEKRPLGAFSTDSESETAEVTDKLENSDFAPHPSAETSTPDADSLLPAELQDDLLKIEAGSSTLSGDTVEQAEDVSLAEIETPAVLAREEIPAAIESAEPTVETAAPSQTESTPVEGPTSIVQQYKEQPNTGDQTTGAIYDTNSYHKSLVHPIKKKSGWLWVLYIVILMVVGAAVGAGVFYFVFPLINGL